MASICQFYHNLMQKLTNKHKRILACMAGLTQNSIAWLITLETITWCVLITTENRKGEELSKLVEVKLWNSIPTNVGKKDTTGQWSIFI